MKHRPVIILSAALITLFGGAMTVAYFGSRNDTSSQPATVVTPPPSNTASTRAPESAPASTPGTYVDYSASALASAQGTRILFFHASWCSQCRQLEADIKRRGVPENVTILKVDYDSSQALRKQYGVTLQTTVVRIDGDGKLVRKFVPYDEPSLASVTKQLL